MHLRNSLVWGLRGLWLLPRKAFRDLLNFGRIVINFPGDS